MTQSEHFCAITVFKDFDGVRSNIGDLVDRVCRPALHQVPPAVAGGVLTKTLPIPGAVQRPTLAERFRGQGCLRAVECPASHLFQPLDTVVRISWPIVAGIFHGRTAPFPARRRRGSDI